MMAALTGLLLAIAVLELVPGEQPALLQAVLTVGLTLLCLLIGGRDRA
jgi:hypothetical protein